VWARATSTEARRRRRRLSEVRGFAARTLALSLFFLAFDTWDVSAEVPSPPAVSTASIQASSTPQVLASHVRAIFQARCEECHGANLARPKGKFGYVLDLARIAANPKMVIPGMPAQSEIYQTVLHNEMPPPKSQRPPLTPEEKEIVKSWIEAGAAAPLPSANTTAVPPLTLGQRILRDLGQFHPPSAHFPIALLIVALPAEFLWMLTRKDNWKATVRFCVTLGALAAVTTATLGWCDAPFSSYAGASASVLLWHRWVGTATAAWAVLVATLAEFSNRRENPPDWCRWFRLTLVFGVVLVSVAGYLGASLIYGLNHFTW
jgi:uncharacterized membrane protein/mono/diheme cytochrome c family protein